MCRAFYILSDQCFGIGTEVIDLFSSKNSKNHSLILRYRDFHIFYQFKKMLSIFLNVFNINDEEKLAQIKKFKFEPDSIPFLFQQAMLTKNLAQKGLFFQKGVHLLEPKEKQDLNP